MNINFLCEFFSASVCLAVQSFVRRFLFVDLATRVGTVYTMGKYYHNTGPYELEIEKLTSLYTANCLDITAWIQLPGYNCLDTIAWI